PDCFEREMAPAWIAPRIANHIKVSSVQECLAICASSHSLLEWECTRIVYDNFSHGCLLLGSSPGEGEKLAVDPSFEAYNNLCWLEETTKNEVFFPEEEETPEIEDKVEDLKRKLVAMKQIDDLPTTVTLPSIVSTINVRKCFRRVPQATIQGRADDIYQNVSSTECLEKCMECDDCLGDDLPCMIAIYYDHVAECVLLRLKETEGIASLSTVEETSSLFWRDSNCEGADKCSPHMDLVIILDGSDSIGMDDFQKGLRVVQKLMGSVKQLTDDVRMRVIQNVSIRSLLGSTVSQVIKNSRSATAKFVLFSDLFIEDNPKLIEIELGKTERPLITLSLTESSDRKLAERLTQGDISKIIHEREEENAEERLLRVICGENKREKREARLLETSRVWIGLRRTEEGDLQWSDQSTVNDFSRLSDRPSDEKRCVSSETEWNYTECEKELPFVCTFTPLEKL
ncbi:hypothetical protein PENTCL1PPCAC_28649, partial [Pristionchus entomophagus]